MPGFRDTLHLFGRRFALALQSSTRVRAPVEAPVEDDLLQSSTGHIPGAGWLVGLAACLVFALTSLLVGQATAAAIACTVATVLLTGAQNESGLFRFADRMGRRDAGWGALALFLVLGGKLALLAALADRAEAAVITALFAGQVVSRFAPLVAAHWLDTREAALRTLRVGALWCVVPLALLAFAGGVAFLVAALLACALAGFALVRFTAPPEGARAERTGAVQQVCEVAFYFGAAIAA
ncbi:adenosylcobinamide-GDP ribazoletransferase [Ramlibacter pallidus]|uniref:Adenosylcobinamide-GDP ribazoletransferase n=1 Tax=Ramlibacter pallidus TaxID=2780087 RepID=A0ABR9RZV2_9BURK|nr:adenosylcobinamide-GDP ribazoletransferase [Ramlibacter pallidus]